MASAIDHSIQAFGDVDDRIANEINPDTPTPTPTPTPAPQQEVTPQSPSSETARHEMPTESPSAPGPTTHLIPEGTPQGAPAASEGGAVVEDPAGIPQAAPAASPGQASNEPAAPRGSVDQASGLRGVSEANVVQLYSMLWQRWTAMGGSGESLLAAMAGLGLLGLLTKLGATGGLGRMNDRPGGSGAEGPLRPGDPVGQGVDPEQAQPVEISDSLPFPAGYSVPEASPGAVGEEQAAAEPPVEGVIDAGESTGSSSAAAAPAAAQTSDGAGLQAGPQASVPDLAVAPMPPLESSPLASETANGVAATSLPPLGQAAIHPSLNASSDASLPNLTDERAPHAAMMPGMALGGLAAGSAGRTASASAGGHGPSELPGLREERALGETSGSARTGVEQDALRILEDLRRDQEGNE